MGTVEPSGRVMLVGPADRLTCCWAAAIPAPRRRTVAADTADFRVAFIEWNRMSLFSSLSILFIDYEFPGIDQHHHQHSAGKHVVGGNLALVVRVPHKCPAALVGRVALRVGGQESAGGPGCAGGGIRPQVRTAAKPDAVRE